MVVTYQDCNISLRCSTDHVGHEASVTRGIKDGEVLAVRLKESPADLDGLSFVPLLQVCVESPRQVPFEKIQIVHLRAKQWKSEHIHHMVDKVKFHL